MMICRDDVLFFPFFSRFPQLLTFPFSIFRCVLASLLSKDPFIRQFDSLSLGIGATTMFVVENGTDGRTEILPCEAVTQAVTQAVLYRTKNLDIIPFGSTSKKGTEKRQ